MGMDFWPKHLSEWLSHMSFTVKGILQAADAVCHSLLITLPVFSVWWRGSRVLFGHMRFEVHTGCVWRCSVGSWGQTSGRWSWAGDLCVLMVPRARRLDAAWLSL